MEENNKQILGLGLTLSFVPLFFIFLFPLLVPRFPFVILATSSFDVGNVCRSRVKFVNDPMMKAFSFPPCTFLSLCTWVPRWEISHHRSTSGAFVVVE